MKASKRNARCTAHSNSSATAGPASLGFLRYLIGLMCLLPVLLLRPWRRIAVRDLLPIGLLGIGQFAALIVLLNYSLLHIPAALASLLFATFPLMTMILSAALPYFVFRKKRWL